MRALVTLHGKVLACLSGGWLWRTVAVTLVLQWLASSALHLLGAIDGLWGGGMLRDLLQQTQSSAAIMNGEALFWMRDVDLQTLLAAGGLLAFTGLVFHSIALVGRGTVLLKAHDRDAKRWFADSFAGFRRPLELAALLAVQTLLVFSGLLFFVAPGIYLLYCFRLAWLVKCEHLDWGVWRCLGESARLMRGRKLKALALDLSFLAIAFVLSLAAVILFLFGLSIFMAVVVVLLTVFFPVYWGSALAVFYRETQPRDASCAAES